MIRIIYILEIQDPISSEMSVTVVLVLCGEQNVEFMFHEV